MDTIKKQRIVDAIKTYCETKKVSQNKLANMIGNISSATISQMMNNNWSLIKDEMWLRVANHLGINDNEWNLIATRNFSLIKNLCHDTQHQNQRMVAISGYTGAGKTTALKHYAQNNEGVYYMLCNALMNRKDFCNALQKALGIQVEGRISERLMAVVEELKTRPNPLLIIDDAGKLPDAVIRMLQILYDETEGHLGLMLAGTEYLKTYLKKMADKDKMGFRELCSRIKYWQDMNRVSVKMLTELCHANGVSDEQFILYVVNHSKDYREANAIIVNIKKLVQKGELNVLDRLTTGNKL